MAFYKMLIAAIPLGMAVSIMDTLPAPTMQLLNSAMGVQWLTGFVLALCGLRYGLKLIQVIMVTITYSFSLVIGFTKFWIDITPNVYGTTAGLKSAWLLAFALALTAVPIAAMLTKLPVKWHFICWSIIVVLLGNTLYVRGRYFNPVAYWGEVFTPLTYAQRNQVLTQVAVIEVLLLAIVILGYYCLGKIATPYKKLPVQTLLIPIVTLGALTLTLALQYRYNNDKVSATLLWLAAICIGFSVLISLIAKGKIQLPLQAIWLLGCVATLFVTGFSETAIALLGICAAIPGFMLAAKQRRMAPVIFLLVFLFAAMLDAQPCLLVTITAAVALVLGDNWFRLQQLHQQNLAVVQETATQVRMQVAGQLHGGALAELSAIRLNLKQAKPDSLRQQLDQQVACVQEILAQQIRTLSSENKLTDLIPKLRSKLKQYGFKCDWHIDVAADLPQELEATVVEIFSEIVTNIWKHGDKTQPVTLTLQAEKQYISLSARNGYQQTGNSVGGSSFGLEYLTYLVQRLGGDIASWQHNNTWCTEIEIDLSPQGAQA